MTTDSLLLILRERGLSLLWRGGAPAVKGPRSQLTPALLRVLRLHREALAGRVPRCREWLWLYGHRYTEPPGGAEAHPAGAWWWRYVGETEWRPVPGRPGERVKPPEGS